MRLSIIMPAYNEEKRMIPAIKHYYRFFNKKFKNNFELIIVVNNSSDKTLEIAKDFAKNKKQVIILNFPYYIGKGGAVMNGFKIARGKIIGFSDIDNSTTPENFIKLYNNLRNLDGVIASRRLKGALVVPKRKINQRILSFLFNKVVNLLFKLDFKDTQCGAKLFTRKTAFFLTKNYKETGWAFDVDLLCLCKKRKLKIKEYPIVWTDKEGGKVTFLEGIKAVLNLIKYKWNFK